METLYSIHWYITRTIKVIWICNAKSENERDRLFEKWCDEHPDDKPGAYSPRKTTIPESGLIVTNIN